MGFGILAALFPPHKHPLDASAAPAVADRFDEGEYLELSQRAGFSGARAALSAQQAERDKARHIQALRECLAENGICVYDNAKVERYMNSITPPDHRWYWLPLSSSSSVYLREIYTKPIPKAVLLTMMKIREAIPQAEFEVTDIQEMPKGDPFLRVGLHRQWFIIERWDEPGFRM